LAFAVFAISSRERRDCDAPALLSGQTYSGVDGARKAISGVKPERIKRISTQAADYSLKIPAGNGILGCRGFFVGVGE